MTKVIKETEEKKKRASGKHKTKAQLAAELKEAKSKLADVNKKIDTTVESQVGERITGDIDAAETLSNLLQTELNNNSTVEELASSKKFNDEINSQLVEHLLDIYSKPADKFIVDSLLDNQTTKESEIEKTEIIVPPLSQAANNWKLFLKEQRLTPEEWLNKYPNNKFKHQVEELHRYNQLTGNK